MCDILCVMCDVPHLIFESRGDQKYPHLGSFKLLEWYAKIECRWQLYLHYILQGLMKARTSRLSCSTPTTLGFCNNEVE